MSERDQAPRRARSVAVVGAGVAGLMTALEVAGAGVPVDLFSVASALGAASALESSGILAGDVEPREGCDVDAHFRATLIAGEFLAHQPPVRGMVRAAPGIVERLARIGLPFDRAVDGSFRRVRLPGSGELGAHCVGGLTGHAVVRALDGQLRHVGSAPASGADGAGIAGEPLVRRREQREFIRLVLDDAGTCVGLLAQDLRTMEIHAIPYDAVVLATGGVGGLYRRSIASADCTGYAAIAVHLQGAAYANAELLQAHSTAHLSDAGSGKAYPVPEMIRAAGGRIWVPRSRGDTRAPREVPGRERAYLLESAYPVAGNAVAPDLAARAIRAACGAEGRDVDGGANEDLVYLDVPSEHAALLLERVSRSFLPSGDPWDDGLARSIPIFATVGGSPGGLWVDFEADGAGTPVVGSPRNHATNVPGLYAVGDVDYQYHGAHALPGNVLLARLYGASLAGPAVVSYRSAMRASGSDRPPSIFEHAERAARAEFEALLARSGPCPPADSPYAIMSELRAAMTEGCGLTRDRARLIALEATFDDLARRARAAPSPDPSLWLNQAAPFARRLDAAIGLARLCAASALRREESRGGHHRTDAPRRDDLRFSRNTIALHVEGGAPGGATRFVDELTYTCCGAQVQVTSAIDASLLPPAPRAVEAAS